MIETSNVHLGDPLPARRIAGTVTQAPAPEVPPAEGRHETVLLVEDYGPVRSFLAQALEAAGYHTLATVDGASALEVAENIADPIDLLVTDLVMPGMTGEQVARELRSRQPDLKVLFLSGYAEGSLKQLRGAIPDAAFLTKPFQTPALLTRVRELLDARSAVTG